MDTHESMVRAVAHRSDPRSATEQLYALGHWLLERERPEDAARVFRFMLRAAPTDERAWLALGECHTRADQDEVALELYGAGTVAAFPSVRCSLARAKVLRSLGRDADAREAMDAAEALAEQSDDDTLMSLVRQHRGVAPCCA